MNLKEEEKEPLAKQAKPILFYKPNQPWGEFSNFFLGAPIVMAGV